MDEADFSGAVSKATLSRMRAVERSTAWLRAVAVAMTAAVYMASLGVRREWGPYAASILTVAVIYSLWALLSGSLERLAPSHVAAGTLIVDTGLITLWCLATGGPASEFWALYVISVVSIAVRYDLRETVGGALGQSTLYVVVMTAGGGLSLSSLLFRPAVVVLTGVAVGFLARRERMGDHARAEWESEARQKAERLAKERMLVERLKEIDRQKDEFVATAAHEFRAPLAGIRGVIETLSRLGGQLDVEVRKELLEGAGTQSARLSRLVEDLLTVSRIEEGETRLEIREASAGQLVIDSMYATGTADLVSVEIHDVDVIRCDADRVVRILANLLDNAKKYSPDGARIDVTVSGADDWVRFSVRDRGRGIDSEEKEAVFDRFHRVGEEGSACGAGAGLGLYIVKQLVTAHGGEIRVRDAEGGGAVFEFAIPKMAEAPEAVAGESESPVVVS